MIPLADLFSDEYRHLRVPALCGVALVALIGVGTFERSAAIEKHLEQDVRQSVVVDLPNVQVSVSGRDVSLSGNVGSVEERTLLARLVRQRWGVRAVNVSRLTIAPPKASPDAIGVGPGSATGSSPASSSGGPSSGGPLISVAVPGSNSSTPGGAAPTATTTTQSPTSTIQTTTLPPTTTIPTTTLAPTTIPTTTLAPTTIPTTTIPTTTIARPTSVVPTTLVPPTTVPVTVKPTPDQQALVETTVADILAQNPIAFARNVPTLGPESRLTMDLVADVLKANPNVAVQIGCYTDNRGNPASNQKLSERRANTVRAELMSRGVAPTQMTAVGFGEQKPIASNATEEGRNQNRRVEIVVIR